MALIGIHGKKQSGKNTVAEIFNLLLQSYRLSSNINYNIPTLHPDGIYRNPVDDRDNWVLKKLKGDIGDYGNKYAYEKKSFAHKLKQIVCILTGCTMDDLEDENFKNKLLPTEYKYWEINDRYEPDDDTFLVGSFEEAETYPRFVFNIREYHLTYRETLQRIGTDLIRDKFHPDIWINSLMCDYKEDSKWIITDVRFENEIKAIKQRKGLVIKVIRSQENKDNHQSEIELDNYKYWDYIINNNGTIEDLIQEVKNIMIKEELI